MRKHHKELVLGILETLQEAMNYLVVASSPVDVELMHDTLKQGYSTVYAVLEQFSTQAEVYPTADQIEAIIHAKDGDRFSEAIANIQRHLDVEPIQYKVVFFPYLSSTWDALESIYDAFSADARFMTDVVILPTHRLTPEGRVDLYDDFLKDTKIAHTPYTHYDVEQDQPDIVFMNNPYDSVIDPPFYTERIRANCHFLVYVPYFGISRFYVETNFSMHYQLPVHVVADRIIVQGTRVQQAFTLHCPGQPGRYLPLGTPKIDAFKKEHNASGLSLRSEWENVIQGRPAFLLDTHYTIIGHNLEQPDGTLKNCALLHLQTILNHFSEKQDQFLIWRPHPMTETILNNYHSDPDMRAAFLACYEKANELPNCILDTTESSHNAVALSNAYISVGSESLQYLYLSTGKPVINTRTLIPRAFGTPIPAHPLLPLNDLTYCADCFYLYSIAYVRFCGGDPAKDEQMAQFEADWLQKLDGSVQSLYKKIITKGHVPECLSDGARQAIKGKKPHPVWGYTFDLVGTQELEPFDPQFAKLFNELYYHLCMASTQETTQLIDMIARNEDPHKQTRIEAYQKAIANSDGSCGMAVKTQITADFLQNLQDGTLS